MTLGDVMRLAFEEAEEVDVPKGKWLTMRFSSHLDTDQARFDEFWLCESEEE